MANQNNQSENLNEPMDDNKMAAALKHNNARAQSNDINEGEEEFPGYPHYPASEDIMSSGKDSRVDLNVENLPKRGAGINVDLKDGMPADVTSSDTSAGPLGDMDDDDIVIVPGTEADVTDEDLQLLDNNVVNTEELNRVRLDKIDEDESEDENKELDIPGSEIDDANESIGEEDEENNYYSLGGDAHENLEEDRS